MRPGAGVVSGRTTLGVRLGSPLSVTGRRGAGTVSPGAGPGSACGDGAPVVSAYGAGAPAASACGAGRKVRSSSGSWPPGAVSAGRSWRSGPIAYGSEGAGAAGAAPDVPGCPDGAARSPDGAVTSGAAASSGWAVSSAGGAGGFGRRTCIVTSESRSGAASVSGSAPDCSRSRTAVASGRSSAGSAAEASVAAGSASSASASAAFSRSVRSAAAIMGSTAGSGAFSSAGSWAGSAVAAFSGVAVSASVPGGTGAGAADEAAERLGRALELASATEPGRLSAGASPGSWTAGGGPAGRVLGSRASGRTTTAVTPLPFCSRSCTRTPCRAASNDVTWRPRPEPVTSTCRSPGSNEAGSASLAFSSPIRTADMPMPSSDTESITSPLSSSQPDSSTGESGGEKAVAFSRSSASRWLRSSAANPAIWACGGSDWMVTRSYRSISLTAARATSTSGIGPAWPVPCSAPARTSMFSLYRRMTVAMWSSLNRVASRSGSCSRSSRLSMTPSWRSTRPRVRRERLTKVWLTVLRSCSSSVASSLTCAWSSVRWAARVWRPSISLARSPVRVSTRPVTSRCRVTNRSCRLFIDRTTWANSSLRPV